MTNVISQTEAGVILDEEREAVELHELQQTLQHRETAKLAVPAVGAISSGRIHLDIYPRPNGVEHRGTVVFIGGLSNYALGYATFIARLPELGYDAVALDLRGHGRSSGRRGDFDIHSSIVDIRTTVDYAADRFGGPIVLMGSSLGGFWSLVGANAIDKVDAAISHFVMLPDMPVTAKDRRMAPVAKLLNKVAPGFRLNTKSIANWDGVSEDPKLKANVMKDPLMAFKYSVRALASGLTYAPSRPLHKLRVPHLVIHGENDRMTPRPYLESVFARLEGDKELAIIPGAGHMGGLIEHQDEVVDVVANWLGAHLPARVSA
jgi:lysophospholipase